MSGYSPILELGDGPLTPREKVAGRGPAGAVMDALWPILGGDQMDAETWTEISMAVGTALASGSGDHAELARLCSEAKAATTMWHADKALRAIEQICSPDYLLSLLAENAALRAERDTWKKLAENGAAGAALHIDRATEAERKLAEAVGLLRDLASWFDGSAYNGAWVIRSGDLGVDDAICAARTFLSKEAERG